MLVFRTPSPARSSPDCKLGDADGITAGNGRDGAGDTERRTDGEEPNDDLRLCEVGGGFIGSAKLFGVPGADGGAGEPGPSAESVTKCARPVKSGGAGLFEDILRAGRSIFATLLCCARENWPSFVFRV